MKKVALKVSESSHVDNILLFAIASAESDLHICMLLNKALDINLSLAENLELKIKKKIVSFRRYTYEVEDGIEKYSLFLNRSGSDYLFSEIKKIDFILLISSEGPLIAIEQKIIELKSSSAFTAIYKLDQKALKSFEHIIN